MDQNTTVYSRFAIKWNSILIPFAENSNSNFHFCEFPFLTQFLSTSSLKFPFSWKHAKWVAKVSVSLTFLNYWNLKFQIFKIWILKFNFHWSFNENYFSKIYNMKVQRCDILLKNEIWVLLGTMMLSTKFDQNWK